MVTQEEILRIVAVRHPDPHGILGPHAEGADVVVRAFRPHAFEVTVRADDGRSVVAARIHEAGLFEARFPQAALPMPYVIETRKASGTFVDRDPYAFAPTLGPLDLHLIAEGTHQKPYDVLGAHARDVDGISGTSFAVWAPNAERVSVTGDFNEWKGTAHPMRLLSAGVWEIFIPGVGPGALYKLEIVTRSGHVLHKADPFGRAMELRPKNASRIHKSRFAWTDEAWMKARAEKEIRKQPISIYEVHLGSWRHRTAAQSEGDPRAKLDPNDHARRFLTYRELAHTLLDYVAEMGFTHVELLPVMEHPFDGSWGYQVSGYYAPTARYGDPDDLRYFVDEAHRRGIGVILDWVPAHFPKDAFALGRFDGTALFEHLDPRLGEHTQWRTFIFNYGRNEVRNFLISNAMYWLESFHADGLRVDAVASMLYLDYGKGPGQWVPNKFGGRENLEAVAFLRELTDRVHSLHPGALVSAEESTSWPGVTHATYAGGLGFDLKWNMGWMHDSLRYFSMDSIFRSFHHNLVTFGLMYAFSERFLLPLSHDEVVHLKRSLLLKMPGDAWKMRANLRSLYAYMWAHPGKKLLFMGGEIGQLTEWNEAAELAWHLLGDPDHLGIQALVRDLNRLYKAYPALWEVDGSWEGFAWIDANDAHQSVAAFVRFPEVPPDPPEEQATSAADIADVADDVTKVIAAATVDPADRAAPEGEAEAAGSAQTSSLTQAISAPTEAIAPAPPRPPARFRKGTHVVFVGNFTPVPRYDHRVGVPRLCRYREVLNTDAAVYGGSGMGNLGGADAEPVAAHGFEQSLSLTLPPLAVLWLVPEDENA